MTKQALIITTVSGFVQQFEREDVKLLQELGYTVHYASNPDIPAYDYPSGTYEEMGVIFHPIPVIQNPKSFCANQKAYRQLKMLVCQHRIRLIHCHTPVGGALGRMIGRHFGDKVKVIYTAHGFHFYQENDRMVNPLFYRIEKRLAKYTDALITINQEDFNAAQAFQLRGLGNVYQIPGVGINPKIFAPVTKEEYDAARTRENIRSNDFYIVSVGELNENKNHILILQALNWLRENGTDIRKIRCDIFGNGSEYQNLKGQISAYQLEYNVRLRGYANPIRPVLAGADVFLFPSRREGLGLAAIEALSCGIPVLAAKNRGSREYLQHGKNGYHFPWNDAAGCAFAILRCMTMDGIEVKEMRKTAVESVKPFLIENTRQRMQEIYKSVDTLIVGDHL